MSVAERFAAIRCAETVQLRLSGTEHVNTMFRKKQIKTNYSNHAYTVLDINEIRACMTRSWASTFI